MINKWERDNNITNNAKRTPNSDQPRVRGSSTHSNRSGLSTKDRLEWTLQLADKYTRTYIRAQDRPAWSYNIIAGNGSVLDQLD